MADAGVERLTLWDADGAPPAGAGLAYSWTGYAERGEARAILRYVEAHAERLRARYAEWTRLVGERRVGGVRLLDAFPRRDRLGYWWMMPFVEQSPWKSPWMMDMVRLLALEEIIGTAAPRSLRVVSDDARLAETLAGWAATLGIAFIWDRPGVKAPAARGLRAIYKSLPHPARAVLSLARHVRTRWPLRALRRPAWHAGPDALFIASYFIHLDRASCESGRFHSRHWEQLPALARELGFRVNWLQHYLQSDTVPDTGVAIAWARRFNGDAATQGTHAFVDSYLGAGVVWRVVKGWFALRRAERRLGDPAGAFASPVHGLPLWPLVRDEWAAALRGSLAVDNLLWGELFDAALADVPPQPTGLYLLENQSWERAFMDAWRRHGHGRLIGVVHSTVRFWDLRYVTSPALVAEGSPMPQPHVVALNGPAAVAAYRAAAFPAARTVETEALRYGNLLGLDGGARDHRPADRPLRLLALGDYHAAGTEATLRLLEAAMRDVSGPVHVTVKPHPNCRVRPEDYPGMRFELVDAPLAGILDQFDIAYASNNTSASVDAFCAGLRVAVMLDERELNVSPLRGMPGVRFVSTPAELAAAMRQPEPGVDPAEARRALFHLDPALPRWHALLGRPGERA